MTAFENEGYLDAITEFLYSSEIIPQDKLFSDEKEEETKNESPFNNQNNSNYILNNSQNNEHQEFIQAWNQVYPLRDRQIITFRAA